MKLIELTEEQAKELYKLNPEYRTNILHSFTDEELGIKPEYPTRLGDISRPYYLGACGDIFDINVQQDINHFTLKERAQEVLALIQVLAFRDAVWEVDNWKPDWNDGSNKFAIYNDKNDIVLACNNSRAEILTFKTPTTRDWFLKTHKELIEQCKNLL